ncbi:MAG: hypothetical protein PHI98_02220, partial [Eubacteriales bacterium]|nr:hypothetical protein [Eubacteriales bacterium]
GFGLRITKRQSPFWGHLWPSDGYGLQDPSSGSLLAVSPTDGFFVVALLNGCFAAGDQPTVSRMTKLLLNAAFAAYQHESKNLEKN